MMFRRGNYLVSVHKTYCRNCFLGAVAFHTDTEQRVKSFKSIPGPRGLPIFGTLLDYKWKGPYTISHYNLALIERYKHYGDIFRETIAGEEILHLCNPDYFKIVLEAEGKVPHIPPLQVTVQKYRQEKKMSLGLGNTNGEEWYRLRSAVQQMMMRPKSVQEFLPLSDKVADRFLKRIGDCLNSETGEVPEFDNEIKRWILESAGMICFGRWLGFLSDNIDLGNQMINANNNIFQLSCDLKFSLPIYKYVNSPKWTKLVKYEDYFVGRAVEFIDSTVNKVSSLLKSSELDDKLHDYSFMAYLLSRKELSEQDVIIISLSLFGDGLSTTAPTLVGQLYCLSQNEQVQEKLRKEINSVVVAGQPITSVMLGKMPYLKACVKEGFRLFPVGTETSRITQKALVIGGYDIPKHTHVEMNQDVLLKSAQYFQEPLAYKPERWMRGSGSEVRDIHPFLLTPFGHGPRMCAGRRFAEQDIYIFLCKLLQRYHISYHHGPMSQIYKLLLKPDKPAQFTFSPISR